MSRLVLAACGGLAAWSLAVAQPPPPVQPAADAAGSPAPVIVIVGFPTLAETFATNEVRADELYAGKTVRVTGTLSRVAKNPDAGTDGKDAFRVELRDAGGRPADVEVTFLFPATARRTLAALPAGTEVVVQGRCGRPVTYPADGRARLKDFVTVAVADSTVVGLVAPIPPAAVPLVAVR